MLVILALVQFTSIVDFMVIMPLGPIMMRKLELDRDCSAWSSRPTGSARAGGAAGFVDHGPVRTQDSLFEPIRRISAGDARVRAGAKLRDAARREGITAPSGEFWVV